MPVKRLASLAAALSVLAAVGASAPGGPAARNQLDLSTPPVVRPAAAPVPKLRVARFGDSSAVPVGYGEPWATVPPSR